MNFQNGFATANIGQIDGDLTVETARTQERGIEHVGTVGGGDNDDAFLRVKAVHLHEQSVQRLLALVVAAAETMTARAAHGVNFINEDEAGRILAGLLKHVAHAARADAHKHFHEIGTADAEEAGIRFAGNGLGEERLARTGRSHHEHTLGNATAEALEFFRVAQEFNQFGNFLDGLVHASHILEGGFVAILGQHAGLAFAETQGAFAGHLDLPDEKEPEKQRNEDDRTDGPDRVHEHGIGRASLDFFGHQQLVQHLLGEINIGRGKGHRDGLAILAILKIFTRDGGEQGGLAAEINGGLGNLVGMKFFQELGLGQNDGRRLIMFL